MADKNKPESFWDTFGGKFVLSAIASAVAETATFPLDLTKTRLQIQGEHEAARHHGSGKIPHRGFVQTVFGIVREEGFFHLWQGARPAVYRHIIYTGARMGFYEKIRELLGKNTDGTFPIWKAVIGGLTAGALGQFIANPMDLAKVQLQMEGRRLLEGHEPRVKNTWQFLKETTQSSGIRGLWRGWAPNVQRAALVNMGDLATYDTAKHALLKHTSLQDNYVTHTLASGASGIVAALVSTPADVVKTRIMNQPLKDGKGVFYKSSLDCLMKTIHKEGFLALYKGLIPIYIRMAPWSLVFWLTYENVRKVAGTSSF